MGKYNINFTYIKDNIQLKQEVVDTVDVFCEAEEYVQYIEDMALELEMPIDYGMPITDSDNILVEVTECNNNNIVSKYLWKNKKMY